GGRVPRPVDPRVRRALAGEEARGGLARRRTRAGQHLPALARRRSRDVGTEGVRPAYYALGPGGWRDYLAVLHLPDTLWNVSDVALGAGVAPRFDTGRMLWTMAAFALALGVAAHALDELHGRPLGTRIGSGVLLGLAVASLAVACAIGVWAA